MHVGGARTRLVQGADADEPAGPEAAGVLAPYIGAAGVAEICGMPRALEMDGSRRAREQRHGSLLDHRVHHEGAARHALALRAVAGVDDHRLGGQLEPDISAGTAAFM